MARRVRPAGLLAVSLTLALVPPSVSAAALPEPAGGGAQIDLAEQTPIVAPGGTFVVRLDLAGVPPDGIVALVLHQRVRSRSELDQSMDGDGLRSQIFGTATSVAALPTQPDGTKRLTLSLDPAAGGVQLRTEGIYPVELIAQDAAGTELARLVTHLIVAPEVGDDSPPLGVAVVAQIGAPPALQPDDTIDLTRRDVEDMAALVTGLAAAPDVPATIDATPETIEALLSSPAPGDTELVDALRTAAADRSVTAAPYVDVSPDDLGPPQVAGRARPAARPRTRVLADALGVQPTGSTWMAPPDLGATGLGALAFVGVPRVVVADDQVEPLDPGIISYSIAQPFLLAVPEDTPSDVPDPGVVQALVTDPVVLERLATDGAAGLVASRVLSELAFMRLEQPSVARSVVLPLPPGTPARVVQLVLGGLGAGRPFAPMSLDDAFEHAVPLVDAGGNQVDRPLVPVANRPIRSAEGRALDDARAQLATFTGLVGADSALIDPLERHLLLATASRLRSAERRAHVDAVEAGIDAVAGQVSTPATFTLTLAAREGTIPLTIRNDSEAPLQVSVRLRSQKLDFPEGDVIDLVLDEPTERIDIPVRALASGAFPLEVDVRTPDGLQSLTTTRYTVRSTAVSGAGLVLSVGAGIFLVVWWARHWHRTRRSAKLIAARAHPAARRAD